MFMDDEGFEDKEEFTNRESSESNFHKKGLKVNKRFENEVKEKESRGKIPKYLIESCSKKTSNQLKPKKSD